MEMTGLKDEELVRRYLEGEPGAIDELLARYQRIVYNLAYRMSGNPADAADLTQDIFIQVIRKLGTFRGESSFHTWLFRLGTNLCYDFFRRRKRAAVPVAEPQDMAGTEAIADSLARAQPDDPENAALRSELANRVQLAVMGLPPKFRAVVVLHDFEELRYHEIADALDISIGTVKSRLNRARLRLATELGPVLEKWERA